MLHLCLYEASCYFTRGIGPQSTQLGLDGVISIYLSILALQHMPCLHLVMEVTEFKVGYWLRMHAVWRQPPR